MFQRSLKRIPAAGDRRRPPWPLLIESPDPGLEISDFDAFRYAGFEVTACAGPAATAGECPVVRGAICPLMADADVVLFDLDCDPPTRSAVLAAMRAARPGLPIVVQSAAPPLGAVEGCATIAPTTSINGQVATLRAAVLRPTRPSGTRAR